MKEIKNVILCGLGAIGSIYADKLSRNIPDDFKVLITADRLERYKKKPITYNGAPLNLRYILPEQNDYKADLIIIATKLSGLDEAIEEIRGFVGEDTLILSLLNGVTSEQIIAQHFGPEKLLYSYFIGHSSVRVGNAIIHDDVNIVVFGSDKEYDNQSVERVKQFFEKTGIKYLIPEDIKHSMWVKYMLNVSANPTTALFRKTFGEMLGNPKFMELAVKIMKEVQLIAEAEGINHPETLVDETLAHLKTMIPEGKTSMLQDVEAGRPTESETFLGTVVRLGEKHNIETPYCKILYEFFGIIDA